MQAADWPCSRYCCRSPHGERGLKYTPDVGKADSTEGRSPHGERGLKCDTKGRVEHFARVALLMESVD